MNRNKKILLGGLALAGILLIGGAFMWKNFEKGGKGKSSHKSSEEGGKKNKKTKYKTVRVSDGTSAFTFEVPKKWLVETRHSGEKKLSTEEMREFLATNYDGDIKADPNKFSGYSAGYSWESIKEMTDQQISDEFARNRDDGFPAYPNASVSGNAQIWYTDTNWQQADFYIVNKSAQEMVLAEKNMHENFAKENCANKSSSEKEHTFGCRDEDLGIWSTEKVGGRDATMVAYPTDQDEKGNEYISKGGPGNKNFYVPIDDRRSLVIQKQARGDESYEKGFSHMIETLKFE